MKNSYSKAIIFLGGELRRAGFVKALIDDATFLVGADGGVEHIYKLGLKPHAVIGDFDSAVTIPDAIKKLQPAQDGTMREIDGITYIKYPTEKDHLDSELAIEFALHRSLDEIILVGNLSPQTDYVLGNIFLLNKREYTDKNIRIVQENLEIYIISGTAELHGKIGQKLSLIPLFGKVEVSHCSGLTYDLSQYEMSLAANSGIGNSFTASQAKLTITSGKILVMIHQM